MKRHLERDPASSQYQFCYTGDELLQYRSGKVTREKRSQIFFHLNVEKCERCRELFHSLKEPAEVSMPSRIPVAVLEKLTRKKDTPVIHVTPSNLKEGQIWTTAPDPKNTHGEIVSTITIGIPVLIISAGSGERDLKNIIRVIPISLDVDYHFGGYSLVLNETSPLKFPTLLEIFNERPMLAGNLGEYRGSLSDKDIFRVKEARKAHQNEEISSPGKEILEWMQKEIKLTEYLTFPVNEGLWEEEIDEEGIEIILYPYRKAADTSGVELSEIKTHMLMETDKFSLFIIQKRDHVLLRYVSDTIEPQNVRVDGESKVMKEIGSGLFELLLGEVNMVSESSELKITINGEQLTFQLCFTRKNGA
ncbi:MAG: hypothetical protein U9R17_15060 [Thermodesulfobacteriota bacterium]|nr:hypothetical protein [Thermodesulfobacteriota bacterium]